MPGLVRKAMVVAVAAVALVGIVSAPVAEASRPTIAFVSPSPAEGAALTSDSVAFKFTYNRKPKATDTLVCTLSGPTSSTGPCDAPVAAGTKGSQSGKSYSCLANGTYTFTVSLTLTDGGTASATRHFTIDAPAVRHLYWANFGTGTIGRASVDGTGANQSFVTGASEPRGVAVDAGHVYWANSGTGTIGRANLDGTGANQSFITGPPAPRGWRSTPATSTGPTRHGTIGRANLDGTGANQSFVTGASDPTGVAVDAG